MRSAERRISAIALAAVLCATGAQAARDHLVPEDSKFASGPDAPGFGSEIEKPFADFYARGVVARMIGEPSFIGKYAVGIEEQSDRYSILYIELDKSNAKPKVRCETDISSELGIRIMAAWRAVLLETRFSDDLSFGLDGAMYHFSMWEKFQEPPGNNQHQPLYGRTWSPDPSSPPGMLVNAGGEMADYCTSHDVKHLQSLDHILVAILGRLNTEH